MRLAPAGDAMESSAINALVAQGEAQQAEIERLKAELAASRTDAPPVAGTWSDAEIVAAINAAAIPSSNVIRQCDAIEVAMRIAAAKDAELAIVTAWKQQAIDAMLNFRHDDMVRLVMAELNSPESVVESPESVANPDLANE